MSFRIDAILAATDLSHAGRAAIAAAAGLAGVTGARLHVVHALEDDGTGVGTPELEGARQQVRVELEATAPRAAANAGVHVAVGAPHEAILQWAGEVGADLLVIGPHRGDRAAGEPLGAVADQLVRTSDVPCLIVRGPLSLPLRRIVVPSDLSEAAQGALDVAFIWGLALRMPRASGESTRLEVLHAADVGETDASAEDTLNEQLAASTERTGGVGMLEVSSTVVHDAEPASAILGFAAQQGADLLVLGTHGASARSRSEVGSVSSAIARGAELPVLLVPPGYWKEWQERNALLEEGA